MKEHRTLRISCKAMYMQSKSRLAYLVHFLQMSPVPAAIAPSIMVDSIIETKRALQYQNTYLAGAIRSCDA